MHIHYEKEVDIDRVAQRFCLKQSRRMNFGRVFKRNYLAVSGIYISYSIILFHVLFTYCRQNQPMVCLPLLPPTSSLMLFIWEATFVEICTQVFKFYPGDSGQTTVRSTCLKFEGPTIRIMRHLLRSFLE